MANRRTPPVSLRTFEGVSVLGQAYAQVPAICQSNCASNSWGSATMPCCQTNPARATTGATGGGALHAVDCKVCVDGACSRRVTCSWSAMAALVRAGPSSCATEAVVRCRQGDANSAGAAPRTQGLRHKTCSNRWGRARFAPHIGGGGVRLAATVAGVPD